MTVESYSNLVKKTEYFCNSNVTKLIIEPSTNDLLAEILVASFYDREHLTEYSGLITQIQTACNCSPDLMSDILGTIGVNRYDEKSPALAHWIHQQAMNISPTKRVRNNMAYICRRHRNEFHTSVESIIDLLLDGVKSRDAFSLINMALAFSQMLGNETDWILADRMIKLIQDNELDYAQSLSWWGKLADNDDDEGVLVLQWLKRHDKSSKPLSFSQALSILNLKATNTQIPRWVFEKYEKN